MRSALEAVDAQCATGQFRGSHQARELRDRAEDLIERSKEILSTQKDSLRAAVEAGKAAYKEKKWKAAANS